MMTSSSPPPPQQTDDSSSFSVLRGVLFRSTIRGGHATLAIIPSDNGNGVDDEEDNDIVMIVVQMGGAQWKNKETKDDHAAAGTDYPGSSSGQFANNIAEMRSTIRRMCKLGNELEFIGKFTKNNPSTTNNNNDTSSVTANTTTIEDSKNTTNHWNTWRKFTVDYNNNNNNNNLQSSSQSSSSSNNIQVVQVGKWDAARCQRVRCKFFDDTAKRQRQQPLTKKKRRDDDSSIGGSYESKQRQHTSAKGKQKRMQGELLADFVLWMLSTIYFDDSDNEKVEQATEKSNNNEWVREEIGLKKKLPTNQHYIFIDRWEALHPTLASSCDSAVVQARNELVAEKLRNDITNHQHETNTQSSFPLGGILDAAGGAGHVSLALTLRGIQSTVVDPRPTIGKLPGRDRKVLKKSKSKVPFSTYRAWFGSKPEGVDAIYREGRTSLETFLPDSERSDHNPLSVDDDGQQLPICSMSSDDKLLPNCAAIVALHPDEATGVIVQTAVQNKIPFVCVPCCVFSRLFPERTNPGGRGGMVSTYYELIDWLVDLHPAIRVTTLPFEGANIAVWATFH